MYSKLISREGLTINLVLAQISLLITGLMGYFKILLIFAYRWPVYLFLTDLAHNILTYVNRLRYPFDHPVRIKACTR